MFSYCNGFDVFAWSYWAANHWFLESRSCVEEFPLARPQKGLHGPESVLYLCSSRLLLVYNQDFSSHVILFCSFCNCSRVENASSTNHQSPSWFTRPWPARLICLTIIQRSEFSWLWHPQNTKKKKDFLDFAGLNKDRNTILLRNSSEGLWLGLKKHWSQGFKNP